MAEAIEAKPVEVTEKQIVAQLADDVALHGWKVVSYSTSNDLEREEKTLTIKVWRSTAAGEQGVLDLGSERRKRGRPKKETDGSEAPATAAGSEANPEE